ncbi:hypothetical protein IIA16_03775 [bacterium]|nr:hypothetical protein [bacterium]
MDHLTRTGVNFKTDSEGFGDLRLIGGYDIYRSGGHTIALSAGLSFPTGSTDERDDTPAGPNQLLPYPMQNGSGTFDLLPGVTYTGRSEDWSWGGQFNAMVRLGENDDNYTLGNVYSASVWGARRWVDWLSSSARLIGEVVEDIESLNRRALAGDLEVTAISFHLLAKVADRYAVLDPGSSMGLGFGPVLIAREPLAFPDLGGRTVALPGPHTTATLLMRTLATGFVEKMVPFDEIMGVVGAGGADAGLLIHEGQITYGDEGFVKVADFGELWHDRTGLPLPLGTNVVRRDLGDLVARRFARVLLESITWANAHRLEANEYARSFGRGLDEEKNDRFIRMYVNERTISMGEVGELAVGELFAAAVAAGALPAVPNWRLVAPEPA